MACCQTISALNKFFFLFISNVAGGRLGLKIFLVKNSKEGVILGAN
jgi:hypothetical protein